MGKQNLLSVVVADDEQELLGAVCQLIDSASGLSAGRATDWTLCSWSKSCSRTFC